MRGRNRWIGGRHVGTHMQIWHTKTMNMQAGCRIVKITTLEATTITQDQKTRTFQLFHFLFFSSVVASAMERRVGGAPSVSVASVASSWKIIVLHASVQHVTVHKMLQVGNSAMHGYKPVHGAHHG